MEKDCCEFICGAPPTFHGFRIEWNRIDMQMYEYVSVTARNFTIVVVVAILLYDTNFLFIF